MSDQKKSVATDKLTLNGSPSNHSIEKRIEEILQIRKCRSSFDGRVHTFKGNKYNVFKESVCAVCGEVEKGHDIVCEPFKSEYSARQESPNDFIRFRRQEISKGTHAIYGITKNGRTQIQSLRFDKDHFTEDQATSWLKDNNFNTRSFETPTKKTIAILSKNEDEQYILGVVLEPNDGKNGAIYQPDSQGDIYSAEEIRQAAFLYMERFQNAGLNHTEIVNSKVKVVESYISPVDFIIGDVTIYKGTWLMGMHVLDKDIWLQIKSGDLNGLSIGGRAKKVPQ